MYLPLRHDEGFEATATAQQQDSSQSVRWIFPQVSTLSRPHKDFVEVKQTSLQPEVYAFAKPSTNREHSVCFGWLCMVHGAWMTQCGVRRSGRLPKDYPNRHFPPVWNHGQQLHVLRESHSLEISLVLEIACVSRSVTTRSFFLSGYLAQGQLRLVTLSRPRISDKLLAGDYCCLQRRQ